MAQKILGIASADLRRVASMSVSWVSAQQPAEHGTFQQSPVLECKGVKEPKRDC